MTELEYRGGLDVPGPHHKSSAAFHIDADDGRVGFHMLLTGNGHGNASMYQRIAPDIAREVAFALVEAADTADRQRAVRAA